MSLFLPSYPPSSTDPTGHLPPEAGARLMRRTVTVTEWEPIR